MVSTLPRAVVPSCHCGCVVRGQKSGIFTHLFQDVLRLHMFFDHLVFGVSHTATSTSVHYSFPSLLFPGVWGSCCFVLPRWSVEEFHTPSIFLCCDVFCFDDWHEGCVRVKTLDEYTCLPYSVDTGLGEASGQAPTVPEILYFVAFTNSKKGEGVPITQK